MKICISFQSSEEKTVAAIFQALKQIVPKARIHKSEHSPPFMRLYMTTKGTLQGQKTSK